jgi:hypothetical protein
LRIGRGRNGRKPQEAADCPFSWGRISTFGSASGTRALSWTARRCRSDQSKVCRDSRWAKQLFLQTLALELEQAQGYRIWAYRKTAWAVDEHPENIAELYAVKGKAGLYQLPGVGKKLSATIAAWIEDEGGRNDEYGDRPTG